MAFKMKGSTFYGSPIKEKGKTVVGENTSEIKKDKKNKDYALILEDSKNFAAGDTIRPGNARIKNNYIIGGDYTTKKKSNKNYEITGDAK
jgi:hypothetical protein